MKRLWYRVLSDRQVKAACDLRGVPMSDGGRVVFQVIPDAFNCYLRRFYTVPSSFGSRYGRWECVPFIRTLSKER